MKNCKIFVIGGGPAGSSAASFLAIKGHDVTLFEKEKFPRPHVGESLLPFNYGLFDELGVLDKMTTTYNRKPGVKFSNSDGSSNTVWYFKDEIDGPSSLSFHVERDSFDKMLLDRSKELGVKVFEETPVRDVEFDNSSKQIKISVQNPEGEKSEFIGDFVIDASGQSTFLAKKLQNKNKYEGLDRVAINSHWLNPKYNKELEEGCIEIIHLGGEKLGWIWAIPVSSAKLSVGVVISAEYYKQQRKLLKGERDVLNKIYNSELNESPLISDILADATQENSAMAHGDYSYYSEKKYGSNYAIIGDAGAFLDPIFSSGIYVGMMSSKMVAQQLDTAFEENLDVEEALKIAFDDINGGYDLVEKLIRIFYDPNAIALSKLSEMKEKEYEKFHTAYQIYHFLLQGDFLDNYKKYINAAELLTDMSNFKKFKNLLNPNHKKEIYSS